MGSSAPASFDEVVDFLEDASVGIYFHIGYGSSGLFVMETGGDIGYSSFADGGIKAQYNIIMASSTLEPDNWIAKIGTDSKGMLGYSAFCSESDFDTTVDRFIDNMGDSHTMAWIWYQANLTTANSQEWRAFYREDSGIVDYGPSNLPVNKSVIRSDLTKMNELVSAAVTLLSDKRTFESVFAPLQANGYVFDGQVKPTVQDFRLGQAEFLTKTPITESSALTIAEDYLGDTLPKDAVLEHALPITATYEGGEKMTVAYAVRYSRILDGLSIESNDWKHHIEVLVNDGKVASVSKLWPEITSKLSNNSEALDQILTLQQVIRKAAEELASFSKTAVTIVNVEPVYANKGNEIIRAYALITDTNQKIIVDAQTGQIVRR